MTISEMHIAFKLELDESSALENPYFEPEEIDFWLNQAVENFVKTRYSGVNPKRDGFEQSQKRIDDLRTLIEEVTLSTTSSGTVSCSTGSGEANLYYTSLPIDYWLTASHDVTISYTDCSGNTITKRSGVREITSDEERSYLDNPYSEHILHHGKAKPLRLYVGDYIQFYSDGQYTVDYLHLKYIRKPLKVDIVTSTDCDLPEQSHTEIVKIAVSMASENTERFQRYQIYQNELNKME